MAEYESFVRDLKEDVLSKEGQEIKLNVRDTDRYCAKPVVTKVYRTLKEGMDKLWLLDPLGRPWEGRAFGMIIVREEDEEKLLDPEYQKAGLKV
jgi:hypothetical protein